MRGIARREFVQRSLALSGAALLPRTLAAAADLGSVDTLILGGRFHTMDAEHADVNALAISGERILALGSVAEIRALRQRGTRVIDAGGLTVLPGFIDGHCHPLMANEAISVNVDFRTIAEVQRALREKAASTPRGYWVLAHMYDDTKFRDGRALTRLDLDEVSRDHPIFVQHRGGHTAVVNSAAFALAGVTAATTDPEGGKFYRDEAGFTGRIAEKALGVFQGKGPWPVAARADNQRNVQLITRRMAAAGLTSTTDAFGSAESWQAYNDSYRAGELLCRVSFMPGGQSFGALAEPFYAAMKAAGIRSGYGDAMLRVGAVKYAADGSASERTMRMSTPYAGRPDDYGILMMDQAAIDAAVDDAVASGYRIAVHANGDVTIDMVLRSYERVLKNWRGENPRLRIEHCSLITPELVRRIKAAGVIPLPFYTYAFYHGEKWHEYGTEKMNRMFAHRSFIDAGIPVAPASDYTPGPYEPMMALQSMVTRRDMQGRVWGEQQRISVEQALRVCTVNGAYASFEERIKGSLTPGKLADIVLLEQDPLEADPERLATIRVARTIMGGRTTHEA